MIDNRKPKINDSFSVEKFDNEILLYTEVGNRAVYLNDTAYAVWLLCKEDLTVEEMVCYLEQAYPEQKIEIRADVITALETLEENKVIEFEDAT